MFKVANIRKSLNFDQFGFLIHKMAIFRQESSASQNERQIRDHCCRNQELSKKRLFF